MADFKRLVGEGTDLRDELEEKNICYGDNKRYSRFFFR